MFRAFSAIALGLTLTASAHAQDGPLNRVGRALDRTGKNIRSTVETEVARGQITAQERDVLARVGKRIDWDKQMAGSTLRIEVQPGGVVVLQGSVASEAARVRAVDLVENTTGVTSVVDQLAVARVTRVIETPAPAVISRPAVVTTPPAAVISRPAVVTSTPAVVVEKPVVVEAPAVAPEAKVIVKP